MTATFVARNIDPAAANAIHDDDVARQFGFTGALVPGVELFARTASALVAEHGEDVLTGGRLSLRFRRPVYDGETVRVEQDAAGSVVLRGPDDEKRSVGLTGRSARREEPDRWPVQALPETLLPAVPESLPPGPMGTIAGPLEAAANDAYVEQIQDPLPLWSRQGLAHPGLLLRAVNLVLMSNVDLGPWIHTASDAHLLSPARVDSAMEVRAVVRSTSVRNGRDEVRYDALVLAGGVPVMVVEHTALFRLG